MNNDVVFETKIEKARNVLRYAITKVTADYSLPGIMIELVIESILSDLKQGRLSFMAEKAMIADSAKEEGSQEDKK